MKRLSLLLISILFFLNSYCQPTDAEFLLRGINSLDGGDLNGAIEYLSKFINSNPQDPSGYKWRGIAKKRNKDYTGAIDDYTKSMIMVEAINNSQYKRSELSILLFNRGVVKYLRNDLYGSIVDLTKSISLDSARAEVAEVYFQRGLVKDKLSDFRGSILDYTNAIQLSNEFSDAYMKRAIAKLVLKEYDLALFDLNKVIELNPQNPEAFYGRGYIKYIQDSKDYIGAIHDFNLGIKLDPEQSFPYIYRGYSKFAIGDIDGACIDWSKAGELGDTNVYSIIKVHCMKKEK